MNNDDNNLQLMIYILNCQCKTFWDYVPDSAGKLFVFGGSAIIVLCTLVAIFSKDKTHE